MCWFDTGTLDFLIIDKKEIFDTTFIDIIFEKRNYFEDFLKCVNGQIPSWLEDDHNIFDIEPFVEDISYSDMIVRLKAGGLHL